MERYTGKISFTKSALILPIPEIESLAQPFRVKYTTDGARGLLPHITILYPFIEKSKKWNPTNKKILEITLARFAPFTFELTKLKSFTTDRVLFLDPNPNKKLLDLTYTIAGLFPDYPPYAGAIPLTKIHPHVTIATCSTDEELVKLEHSISQKITDQLPIMITAKEIWFIVESDNRWQHHTTIKLARGIARNV